MLILWVVGLTEREPLGLAIFLDLLSFAGLLGNSLQLYSPTTDAKYVAAASCCS
jgi:hypothetical protein